MSDLCVRCGNTVNVGRFCPACGAEQPQKSEQQQSGDPWLGRMIADRYEITDLINVGGMGRVYKGVQKMLGRPVAIKVIHPNLTTSDEVVARFMMEARTSSQLNHPNVVNIYDFGQTAPTEGRQFFLVMELLNGPSLASVLEQGTVLSMQRILSITKQTLSALGEAHHLGIVHRDIKPDNIVLMPTRNETDHVKVIDFGIAKVETNNRMTQAGFLLGTPYYMAPEMILGTNTGPSVDLYAVGVILFEMLTNQLPFDGATPAAILERQLHAPRIDPREVVPTRKIPAALAEVCLRSIDVDAKKRFNTASELSEAIERAILSGDNAKPVEVNGVGLSNRPQAPVLSIPPKAAPLTSSVPTPATTKEHKALSDDPDTWPLIGRSQDLQWAEKSIQPDSETSGIAFWGKPGTGRTRIARAVAEGEAERGNTVVWLSSPAAPYGNVGSYALRLFLDVLVGTSIDRKKLVAGEVEADANIQDGLRLIYGSADPATFTGGPVGVRRSMGAAFRWAISKLAEQYTESLFVVVIDDVDQADGNTRSAIGSCVRTGVAGVRFVLTGERCPDEIPRDRLRSRPLRSLQFSRAASLFEDSGVTLPNLGEEISPVVLEAFWRWGRGTQAANLEDLLRLRVQRLPEQAQKVLLAIAVTGRAEVSEISVIVPTAKQMDGTFKMLQEAGLIGPRANTLSLRHFEYTSLVTSLAKPEEISALHAVCAGMYEKLGANEWIELRAHHLLRGKPGFSAFVLAEDIAKRRAQRGDEVGMIAALSDGLRAARGLLFQGETDAGGDACIVFGRKLGAELIRAGQLEGAQGVLSEALDLTGSRDVRRAYVLEQIALLAERRDRAQEAERRRREALNIAEQHDDSQLLARLRASLGIAPSVGSIAGQTSIDPNRSSSYRMRRPTSEHIAKPTTSRRHTDPRVEPVAEGESQPLKSTPKIDTGTRNEPPRKG